MAKTDVGAQSPGEFTGVATPAAPEPRFDKVKDLQHDLPENTRAYDFGPGQADARPVTEGGSRLLEDPNQPRDLFYMSAKTREKYKIAPDEEIVAPRDSRDFRGMEIDRIDQLMDKYDSLELVRGEDGRPLIQGGNYICKIKRDELERKKTQVHDDACLDLLENLAYDQKVQQGDSEIRNFDQSKEGLEAVRAETHEFLVSFLDRAGNYENQLERRGEEGMIEDEVRAAANGRSISRKEMTDRVAQLLEARNEQQKSRGRNRTYSFPGRATR